MSFEHSHVSYISASKISPNRETKQMLPLHKSPLSALLGILQDTTPELMPETINDPEHIKCLVAFSTDTIIGGCSSGLLIIWKNKIRAISYQYKASVNCIVHSSVHKAEDKQIPRKIYAGCENGTVIRWVYGSHNPNRAVAELPNNKGAISSMLLIQNDKILLAGRKDGKINLWMLGVKRPPYDLLEHSSKVSSLQTNELIKQSDPDVDLKLFSSDIEGNIVVWNIEDLGCHHVMHKINCEHGIQRILTCGQFLLSADLKGKLSKWSLEDYSFVCSVEFTSDIGNMCRSFDDKYIYCILTSKIDTAIKVVNLEKMDSEKPFSIKAHDNVVYDICTIPETSRVLTSSADGTLKIWDFSERYESYFLLNKETEICSFYVSDPCKMIVTGNQSGKIEIYEMEGRKRSRELHAMYPCTVTCILVTEDSRYIIAGFEDQKIIGWNAKSTSNEYMFKFDGPSGHTEKVNHLCMSLDSQYLFSVSSDKTIKVWSIVMEKLVITIGDGYSGSDVKSHQNDIVDIKVTKNLIVSASDDGFIIVWDISTYNQLKKLEFRTKIHSIGVSCQENGIVAAGESKDMRVFWDFLDYQVVYDIKGHSDSVLKVQVYGQSNLIYSCSKDQTLKIWSFDQGLLLFSMQIMNIKEFYVPPSQTFIYVTVEGSGNELNSIKKIKNLLFSDEICVYPPEYTYFFKLYVNKIMKQELKNYDPKWQDYLLFPHAINLAYVFIQANQDPLLKSGISEGLRFIKNKNGDSPLSYALDRNNYQCADVLVKKLSKMKLNEERVIIGMIEKQMNQLFSTNLSCLPLLFDKLFEVLTENVEAAGRLKMKAPMINSSESKVFDQTYFIDPNSISTKREFLEFRRSLCRFHIEIGSVDSLRLLNSITDCYNSELFKSQMLKAFLLFKWRQNYFLLIIEAFIYFISLSLLVFYILSQNKSEDYFILIFLMLFNTYSVLQDITKCSDSILKFFKSPWNVLDLTRIVLSYYYTVKQLLYDDLELTGLELLTLCYCLKAIGYFRIFNKYRYLLRVIQEIIQDMIPFFLILFTSTIAFSILLKVSEKNLSFFNSFVDVYLLDQTNFVISLDSFENIFVFFMASLLNPIIMLNLLIAIMGDTYDRIQEDMVVADYREMTELILEAEYFVFWRKFRPGVMAYITRCDYIRNLNLERNEWMGKIRAVKKSIQSLETKFKIASRNIDKAQFSIIEKLKDLSSFSSGLNKRLKVITNK